MEQPPHIAVVAIAFLQFISQWLPAISSISMLSKTKRKTFRPCQAAGVLVRPTCTYVQDFLERFPQYRAAVAD